MTDLPGSSLRFHIRAVYRKLRVHSVAEAVSRALRERLLQHYGLPDGGAEWPGTSLATLGAEPSQSSRLAR